jgi:hypothetical protein
VLAGTAGSNPTGSVDVFLVNVMCCQINVSASGRSLFQRSPTECGVSERDHEAWIMRRSWPNRGCCVTGLRVGKPLPCDLNECF